MKVVRNKKVTIRPVHAVLRLSPTFAGLKISCFCTLVVPAMPDSWVTDGRAYSLTPSKFQHFDSGRDYALYMMHQMQASESLYCKTLLEHSYIDYYCNE
jgi:hypothetical protein